MGRNRETLEMKEEHRMRLLDLSARRGGERLSDLVSEAIEHYLASEEGEVALSERRGVAPETSSEDARRVALALRGSLTEGEAEELAAETTALRNSWRGAR
ncbi:MAG TPA: hypothetical protein VIH93_16770 [Thermoanaerobaculia bacterium]|jgi:hypothetical protein